MITCLTSQPIACSAEARLDPIEPRPRCQSTRELPTFRPKTSTDFLIIPERRRLDASFAGDSLVKQRSLPISGAATTQQGDAKASSKPRSRSSYCSYSTRESPLMSSRRRRRSSSHDTKIEGTCAVYPFSRSERSVSLSQQYTNPLLDTSPCSDRIPHHSTREEGVCDAHEEPCESEASAYDRDSFDVEAHYLATLAPSTPSDDQAPRLEAVHDGKTIPCIERVSCIKNIDQTAEQKPYLLPKSAPNDSHTNAAAELLDKIMPSKGFSTGSTHVPSPNTSDNEYAVTTNAEEKSSHVEYGAASPDLLDFSVTFTTHSTKPSPGESRSGVDLNSRKPQSKKDEVEKVFTVGCDDLEGGLAKDSKHSERHSKATEGPLEGAVVGVLTRRQAAAAKEKRVASTETVRRVTKARATQKTAVKHTKTSKTLPLKVGQNRRSRKQPSTQSSSESLVTAASSSGPRESVSTQMQSVANASGGGHIESETSMEDFGCAYSKWLDIVRCEKIPSIMAAFREWRDINFAIQCIMLAMDGSGQDSENPILQDVYLSTKSSLKGIDCLRKEATEVSNMLQSCLKVMGEPFVESSRAKRPIVADDDSANDTVTKSDGPVADEPPTSTRMSEQTAKNSKKTSKDNKTVPRPPPKRRRTRTSRVAQDAKLQPSTPKVQIDADASTDETMVIDVEDIGSPEINENQAYENTPGGTVPIKRRRNLTMPLSPFVSLQEDITPPKKKFRGRHSIQTPSPAPVSPHAPPSNLATDGGASKAEASVGCSVEAASRRKVDVGKITDDVTSQHEPPQEFPWDDLQSGERLDVEEAKEVDNDGGDSSPSVKEMAGPQVETVTLEGDLSRSPRLYRNAPEGIFCHIHGDVLAEDKALARLPFHYACSMCDRVASRIRAFCKRMQWRLENIERSKRSSWFIHCCCYQNHMIQGDFAFLKTQQGCPMCIENAQRELRTQQKQDAFREEEMAQEHQRRIFATARQNLLNAAGNRRSGGATNAVTSGLAFSDADVDGRATIDSLLRCSNERNPWVVLCIGTKRSGPSYQEAKLRYKKWVKRVHPDKNSHPAAKEAFHILDSAWKRIESSQ